MITKGYVWSVILVLSILLVVYFMPVKISVIKSDAEWIYGYSTVWERLWNNECVKISNVKTYDFDLQEYVPHSVEALSCNGKNRWFDWGL